MLAAIDTVAANMSGPDPAPDSCVFARAVTGIEYARHGTRFARRRQGCVGPPAHSPHRQDLSMLRDEGEPHRAVFGNRVSRIGNKFLHPFAQHVRVQIQITSRLHKTAGLRMRASLYASSLTLRLNLLRCLETCIRWKYPFSLSAKPASGECKTCLRGRPCRCGRQNCSHIGETGGLDDVETRGTESPANPQDSWSFRAGQGACVLVGGGDRGNLRLPSKY